MERLNTAAAYALNALPEDERGAFDKVLAEDKYLTAHVESFRRVAAELIEGLPEIVPVPSPSIWSRIVEETGIDRPATEPPPVLQLRPRRHRYLISIASVAAAFAIGIAAGGLLTDSNQDLMQLANAAAAEASSTSVELLSPAGVTDVNASVIMAADGTGYVNADALPALSEDRTYQLWVIVDGEVISAGLLGNDPDVVQFRAEGDIAGMAISNEIAGGVVVSQSDPVALWLRDA